MVAMKTRTRSQIRQDIDRLLGEKRVLLATDEGTHSMSRCYDVWGTVAGERYATTSLAGANATRCTEEEARVGTAGRMQVFEAAAERLDELRENLKRLQEEMRKCSP